MAAGNLKSSGQSTNLTKINGLPSSEAYDVLVDKKGFVWVGHSLGLSRYDGHNFTNFSSPEQISLSTSDLLEDIHDRIWCHNFSGQIFYVENEKLHLLKNYNARLEHNFPRMLLIGNCLAATTDKGLFIYNILNHKHRYLKCSTISGEHRGTSSLTNLHNQILAYGDGEWFKCDTNGHIKRLIKHPSVNQFIDNSYAVQPFTNRDTVYVISYISGIIHKLNVRNDTVRVTGTIKLQSFINTVNLVNQNLWINTKKESFNTYTGQHIANYNISKMVSGPNGSTWYTSLKFGLLVNAQTPKWQNISLSLPDSDYVRCITRNQNLIVYGTQNGRLLVVDAKSKAPRYHLDLPSSSGAIENIKPINNQDFIIGTSVGIYLLRVDDRKLIQLSSSLVLKEAVLFDKQAYFALSTNLLTLPASNLTKPNGMSARKPILLTPQRSRSLTFDTASKTLYGAFKNDLLKIKNNSVSRVLFNGNSVYASALVARHGKVLAGTFTQGLLLIKPGGITQFDESKGLLSSTVLKIKLFGNHAWVVGNSCLQLFDLDKERFIKKINFSTSANMGVYDLLEDGNRLYIATASGIQYIDYSAAANTFPIKNYLLYSIVNNHDTIFTNHAVLPYYKNNVTFTLAAVSYENGDEIYFKYKLDGSQNNKWQHLPTGVKTVQYASLMPGTYQFKAVAQHAMGTLSNQALFFNLTIQKPWWQQWWFILLLAGLIALLVFAILKIYYKVILDKQKLRYEKILAIEYERQNISRELHDNIGQILSLVKLTLATTVGQTDDYKQQKIDESRDLVGHAITDLRNISKSLSFQNISQLGLTQAIKTEAERVNRSGLVEMLVNLKGNSYSLGEQNELVLFRIFQEALNNTLKHAYAEQLEVDLHFGKNQFELTITDDGKGFSVSNKLHNNNGSGLKNMENRAALIGATLLFDTSPGKGCQIKVVLDTLAS